MRMLTADDFGVLVGQSKGVVLVTFLAKWCSPCASLRPQLHELSIVYSGIVDCFEVNVDEEPELIAQLGIKSVPTVMVFVGGHLREKIVGKEMIETYKEKLESYVTY